MADSQAGMDSEAAGIDSQGLWFTLPDAAKQLGVSPRTARRWVKEGRLRAELRPGPYGQTYFVSADALTLATEPPSAAVSSGGGDAAQLTAALNALTETLLRATPSNTVEPHVPGLSDLTAAVDALRAEVAGLRADLVQARADLPQLTAGAADVPAESSPSEPVVAERPALPAAVEKQLKKAGLGKKQRTKLLDRLSGLFGR